MKILAIVKRILMQIINDKRTLALLLIAPLLILTLMSVVFNSDSKAHIKIGAYNIDNTILNTLKDNDVSIVDFSDDSNISSKISDNSLDAFISINNDKFNLTLENSNITKSKQIEAAVKGAITKSTMETLTDALKKQQEIIVSKLPQLGGTISFQAPTLNKALSNVETSYIYGSSDSSIFDDITPTLIGFFVFFFVFLISGISLLKERTSGTLTKLLASPIKRSEIIFGYLIGYGIFAIIQTIIVVLFSVYVLKIYIAGNILLVILTNVLLAFVALSLGIFLSTFANSEFQMMQFIPIVVVPQILFSGMIPIDNMASWIKGISKVMPVSYGSDALKSVILFGKDLNYISFDLLILLIFSIVLTFLNIIGLKRYRRI